MDKQHLENQFKIQCGLLKSEMNQQGFWTGRLSSSALATSVSIVTFKISGDQKYNQKIGQGLDWLTNNINTDGGFGDSPESVSNVSTSLLCYAAISYCKSESQKSVETLSHIESYLNIQGISLETNKLTKSVLDFYGKDLTFSMPILSMLAICEVIANDGLKKIPQLPFEFALLPNSWYQFFNLQVVSYAIPALIAVGIYLFKQKTSKNPITDLIRKKSIKPALKKLEAIMPESGGFLEAIPLTAFSSMCLMVSGNSNNRVVNKALEFLDNQQRTDGSWPIDTDLSSWVTTLSIKALGPKLKEVLNPAQIQTLKYQLLNLQYKVKHPFNMAKPGGWGWTSYSGSVPDADDTPGAILALLEMFKGEMNETISILQGCMWLLNAQNRDGGIPTFCKGWGRLPFDQSCADLSGHTLLAWIKTLDRLGNKVPPAVKSKIENGINKAARYLKKHQNPSGHWLPLWFGSQFTKDKHNLVYGTSRVGTYILDCLKCKNIKPAIVTNLSEMLSLAQQFIVNQQNTNGSWGAIKGVDGTIEETALAVSTISEFSLVASLKGLAWIENQIEKHGTKSSPIGLYFASLWYDEKMYPLTFYIEALRRVLFSLNNENSYNLLDYRS